MRPGLRTLRFGFRQFFRSLGLLVSQPIFQALTVLGNLAIVTGALTVYFLERGVNSHITSLLDTLWWAVATVTTVGYGDISPITPLGRLAGMALMLVGTTLFWSFTALFAAVLLSPELREMEREVAEIEEAVHELERRARGR